MRILFLGDVVGIAGCSKLMNNLLSEIKLKKIDFVIVNGENAAAQGVGLTKEICNDFFNLISFKRLFINFEQPEIPTTSPKNNILILKFLFL